MNLGLGTFIMRDIPSQLNYWNRVAQEKRFSHPLRSEWLSSRMETEARVLDYGCGYGRTLAELAVKDYSRTVGVDFSAEMLGRCRSMFPQQMLVRNDGLALPFKDKSFGAVLLFSVLTCMPLESDQRTLVAEVARVLRPEGLLYISDLLLNDDERNRERYERFATAYGTYGIFELPEGVTVRHHTVEWIKELTRSFEQLEYEPFVVTTMNGNDSRAFQYLGRKPA